MTAMTAMTATTAMTAIAAVNLLEAKTSCQKINVRIQTATICSFTGKKICTHFQLWQ